MGQRGPNATPKSKLAGRGSKRAAKGKPADGDPLFPPMSPDPPAELDGVALATWQEIVGPLIRDGTLRQADRDCVATYVRTYADCVRVRAILRDEGLVIAGRNGVPKVHPATRLLRQSESMVLALARELGITPASRARVVREPAKPPKEDSILRLVRAK